ncbi:hypothetical protein A6D98_09840 [Aliivibrio fischeri]|uniref:hypothetical protein n=1 Tax=Aliivibrio fischeri TaxID=668 RepID=UPI00080E8611|nr:hypothetical protein [Aliivibrio fischeri]OCH08122.1 hypothetical protein A6E09_17385 [Aliivibrio fischeri]OCH60891.1 hypothetical protein A6D98_09840 [Aliivibrio fischeri]
MNTNAELKQPSTLDALSQYSGDDLIIAFLHAYNQQNSDWDQMVGDNQRLQQELDGYKRQCSAQTQEIQTLQQENKQCHEIAANAEIVANKHIGLEQELTRAKTMNRSLQTELKELNKLNPKKLKEQNKRQQAKALENQKRINQLEQLLKEAGKAIKASQAETNKAVDKIARLQTQLAHDTGSGLYHNGDHHLIIWPQKTKMQDADNNIFEGRSLLYLHKSGRGGLITYNPNTEEANLCASPRGGLRPSDEAKQFAQDWLFKVNEVQGGTVKEEDMIPVNYNGDFAQ